MKFTGHERDLASGEGAGDDLDYMHARHYSPVTGRFLSVDVAPGKPTQPQSWNRNAYALGNPLVYVDPDGKESLAAMRLEQDIQAVARGEMSADQFYERNAARAEGAVVGVSIILPGPEELLLGALFRGVSGAARVLGIVDDAPELPRIARSVGAAAREITTTSRIGENPFAVRLAHSLSEAAQKDVDNLLGALRAGNTSPGIGTRSLGGGFYELRGANAGRVVVKQTGLTSFEIVGKFQGHVKGDKAN